MPSWSMIVERINRPSLILSKRKKVEGKSDEPAAKEKAEGDETEERRITIFPMPKRSKSWSLIDCEQKPINGYLTN